MRFQEFIGSRLITWSSAYAAPCSAAWAAADFTVLYHLIQLLEDFIIEKEM
jgi:hypothetical protein